MEFAKELKIQEAQIRENYITGFIDDRENFLKELALKGFVFSVRNSRKLKPQILTKYVKGEIPIDIGFPFQKNEHTVYDCAHGPKYYKSSYTHEDHITLKKKRFRLLSTKKMNCEATLKIIALTYYPAYPVPENCSWTEKKKIIQQINRNTEGQKRYYLTMSVPSIHNHATTTTFLNQPVNNETQYIIREQVNKGNTNMHFIRDIIESHGTTSGAPSTSRGYFPDNRTIYNYILKFSYLNKKSKIDQESLKIKVDTWNKNEDISIFYRPYAEENGNVTSLLLCLQTTWQKNLLERYGSICLLDATYKTCKYDLPLFFLVVKSNVNYIVVGVFIIQTENGKAIAEALSIFKQWNVKWKLEYFLTDFDNAEINAVKETFNCVTYICAFHRMQAWKRWLKKDNLSRKENKDILLKLWKKIGEILDVNDLKQYISDVESHEVYIEEHQARSYFNTTWMPVIQSWGAAYFNKEFSFKIRTNNGIENQNRILKHSFLKNQVDKSLTNLMMTIVDRFLPESLKKYQNANSKLSSQYKQYNKEIPAFLTERPVFFIKHVYSRYATALSVYSKNSIKIAEENSSRKFVVRSESSNEMYDIDISIPSCSCSDFQKFLFPCKHMCAVFIYTNNCSFDDLPPKYKNSPFLTVDPLYNSFNTETNIISPEVPIETHHELPLPPTSYDSNNNDYPEKNSHCGKEIKELQIVLKSITNTTYLIRDSANINNILRIKNELQTLHTELKKEVRYDEGLITVPAVLKRKSHEELLELPKKKKKSKCTVPNVDL